MAPHVEDQEGIKAEGTEAGGVKVEGTETDTCSTDSEEEREEARLDEIYYGEADMSKKNRRKYIAQVRASGGYEVDSYPGFAIGLIIPLRLCPRDREGLTPYAKEAILFFNINNGTNYEFVELLKANVQACCGGKYYLTFNARDGSGKVETFQGKYWLSVSGELVEECRIKPTTP